MADEINKIIVEIDEGQIEDTEKKEIIRVLSFWLAGEYYCIDLKSAKEVIKIPQITRIPTAPQFIMGVINLRGEVVPIVDIRYFFGLKEAEITNASRLVITDFKKTPVGVLIDRINEPIDVEIPSIQPPLATLRGKLAEYVLGQVQIEQEIMGILDLEKILDCDELQVLNKGSRH